MFGGFHGSFSIYREKEVQTRTLHSRRYVMKLFLYTRSALLTVANVASAARAFSSNPVVLAKVPFNFTVGHDQLPSGTYTISRDPWGLVTMQSIDRRLNVMITTTVEPDSMVDNKLVFRRY